MKLQVEQKKKEKKNVKKRKKSFLKMIHVSQTEQEEA